MVLVYHAGVRTACKLQALPVLLMYKSTRRNKHLGVKKNTITINGKTYDSTTGRPINDLSTSQVISPSHTTIPVTRKHALAEPISKAHKITVKDPSVERSSGRQATTIHVRRERPKTLIRSTVRKPVIEQAPRPAKAVAGLVNQPKHTVFHGHDRSQEVPHSQVIRSKHISKFNHHGTVVVKTASLPVQVAPQAQKHRSTDRYDIHDTPPTLDHFAPKAHARSGHASQPNIFEEALKSANSHKSTHKTHKKHQRLGRLGLAGLSVLILGVFFAYQNAPRIALRNAQSTIGFSASVPSYSPAGFSREGAVQYQKGMVVINFRSNSDDRQYAITQTATGKSNTSLGEDYLATQNKQYETTSIKGQPVYIYDDSRATWISHGVWYTIDGNADLTRDQLTNIVASI